MVQVIFTEQLLHRFKKFQNIWVLIKGTCLWAMWTQRNDKIFGNIMWTDDRIIASIWQALLDYGQAAWKNTIDCRKTPKQRAKLLCKFDRT
jgi:hypothetical protein